MDDRRFQDLLDKRDRVGLSDEEASELGRMFAERMGKPYRNANDLHAHDATRAHATPAEEREAS
jgi:hypothetical protein